MLCQEYHFDYMSTYDYRLHEKDSVVHKFVILANSETNDYLLRAHTVNATIKDCQLFDFSKKTQYKIDNFKQSIEANEKLQMGTSQAIKPLHCDDFTNKYIVENVNIDGVDVIKIKRYKNNKKKKLINECILHTKKSEIKNQHHSFPTLIFPLYCNKFKLETDEVITDGSFFEDGKELHFYKLISFKKIDFKIKF